MARFGSFDEIETVLKQHATLQSATSGRQITIERTQELLQAVGSPEKSLRIIHIAGTSGKTSTSYYTASLLKTAGKRVGLTVSPHVESLRERFQIGLEPISEVEFIKSFSEFYDLVAKSGLEPTYFELLIAFAYWYFANEGVDYAVVETGMGGLHDSTNAAMRDDKICVITDIGLDHMNILGSSVKEIAHQKAGIIHESNKVFMYQQDHEVVRVVEEYAESKQADLTLLNQERLAVGQQFVDGLPKYQQRNWLLAKAAYQYTSQRDGFDKPLSTGDLLYSQQVLVPGRMEEVRVGGVTVVMDGAHNEPKMVALLQSFKAKYPGQKVPVLLALKQGKEFLEILPLLKEITSQVIVTEFTLSQDVPFRAINAHELAEACRKFHFKEVVEEPDPLRAVDMLLHQENQLVLVTGSFYLIGEVRRHLGQDNRSQT